MKGRPEVANGRYITTRFEWLDRLAAISPVVVRLDLMRGTTDETYGYTEAFSFANSEPHNAVIAQTIEGLSERRAPDETIRRLALNLTNSRHTYGAFCELGAHAFLLEGDHEFDIQVPVTGADILNPNGSDLDGLLRLPEEVLFDAKAFGFNEYLVNRLTDRLSAEFRPRVVEAVGSWDVSVSLLFDLLRQDYPGLRDELNNTRGARRGPIQFVLRPAAQVSVTVLEVDPEQLARENRGYAFRSADQFARHKPFFLFFVVHPWLSGLSLMNFAGSFDTFTRSFAYETFHFPAEQGIVLDVPIDEAKRLLTGIIFVNAWAEQPQPSPPRHRCFLNPFARNRLAAPSIEAFVAPYGDAMTVIEIENGD